MKNPNEYNESEYGRSSTEAVFALSTMWEAGASLDEIKDAVEDGLKNAGVPNPTVTITAD